MTEYIILVAVSAIVAALCDVLAPKEWHSYVRVITGFLILTVLLSPVFKIKDIEVFEGENGVEISQVTVKDKVASELSKRVEGDIEERILTEFDAEVTAAVELSLDENHRIAGVKRIVVKGKNVPEGVFERLKEVYGCESIEIRLE